MLGVPRGNASHLGRMPPESAPAKASAEGPRRLPSPLTAAALAQWTAAAQWGEPSDDAVPSGPGGATRASGRFPGTANPEQAVARARSGPVASDSLGMSVHQQARQTDQDPDVRPAFLSIEQVATILTVSPDTVMRLVRSGRLRAVRLSPGRVAVRRSDLDAYMDALPAYVPE